jgi:galactokinase
MSFLDDSNTKQALDAYAQLTREFGSPSSTTAAEAGFISFAPGRVNLIGEHIDYMGGPVVPCALTQGCYTVVQRRTVAGTNPQLPSDLIFIPTANELGIVHVNLKALVQELATQDPEHPDPAKIRAVAVSQTLKNGDPCNDASWSTYLVGALAEAVLNDVAPAKALNTLTFASETVHFVVHGTLAVGAGLSSSAALCCSLIYALGYVFNTLSASSMQDKVRLASRARAIEVKYRGVNIGIMDQFVSFHGVKGQALVLDCGTLTYQPVETPFEAAAGCKLLLINSMVGHQLGGAYNAIRSDMEKVQALLATEGFTAKSPAWQKYVELQTTSASPVKEFSLIRYAQILLAIGKSTVDGPEQEFLDFAKAHSNAAHGEQIEGIDLRFRRAQYVVEEAIRVARFTEQLEGLAKSIHSGRTFSSDEQKANAVRLGQLLSATHYGMAHYLKVSTPEVETIHSTALTVPGCFGGRLVGGGFGGCVLLLVADGAVEEVIRKVQDSFAKAFQLKPNVISIAIGAGAQHAALKPA